MVEEAKLSYTVSREVVDVPLKKFCVPSLEFELYSKGTARDKPVYTSVQ